MTLTFGIYAGGRIAIDDGSPPERPVPIRAALDELHGDHPFLTHPVTGMLGRAGPVLVDRVVRCACRCGSCSGSRRSSS